MGIEVSTLVYNLFSTESYEIAIKLYGELIIALLGILAPIITVLLSVFSEGTNKLKSRFETDANVDIEGINSSIKELTTDKDSAPAVEKNLDELASNLKQIKKKRKRAKRQLGYLIPSKQIPKLFVPLALCFFALLASILTKESVILSVILLAVSFVLLVFSIYVIWNLIKIIIEATREIEEARSVREWLNTESLRSVVKSVRSEELKNIGFMMAYNGVTHQVFNGIAISLVNNIKKPIFFRFVNNEKKMLKNVEAGFIFPQEFSLEMATGGVLSSLVLDSMKQLYRSFFVTQQADSFTNLGTLNITPLRTGNYEILCYAKGENFEPLYFRIKVTVTDLDPEAVRKLLKRVQSEWIENL